MARFFRSRLLAGERNRAAGIERGAVHFSEVAESLFVRGGFEFLEREYFLRQLVLEDLPVFDQHRGLAFDQPVQFLVAEQKAHDEIVDQQQRRGADDAARHAVVVADDGVLHRVRQREQDDQIKRIELRQLALSRQAQSDHQKKIDDDRAQDFLGHGKRENEHVGPEFGVHRCLS